MTQLLTKEDKYDVQLINSTFNTKLVGFNFMNPLYHLIKKQKMELNKNSIFELSFSLSFKKLI